MKIHFWNNFKGDKMESTKEFIKKELYGWSKLEIIPKMYLHYLIDLIV